MTQRVPLIGILTGLLLVTVLFASFTNLVVATGTWWHGYACNDCYIGYSSVFETVSMNNLGTPLSIGQMYVNLEMCLVDSNPAEFCAMFERQSVDGQLRFQFEALWDSNCNSAIGCSFPVFVGAVYGRQYNVGIVLRAGNRTMIVNDAVTGQFWMKTVNLPSNVTSTKIASPITYTLVSSSYDPKYFAPGIWATITTPTLGNMIPYDDFHNSPAPSFAGRLIISNTTSTTMAWFNADNPTPTPEFSSFAQILLIGVLMSSLILVKHWKGAVRK
jgi:hypothetical protein